MTSSSTSQHQRHLTSWLNDMRAAGLLPGGGSSGNSAFGRLRTAPAARRTSTARHTDYYCARCMDARSEVVVVHNKHLQQDQYRVCMMQADQEAAASAEVHTAMTAMRSTPGVRCTAFHIRQNTAESSWASEEAGAQPDRGHLAVFHWPGSGCSSA